MVARDPRKSQKEVQDDQGQVKELGGGLPLAVLRFPGSPGLPSGSSWDPWQSTKLSQSIKLS